MEQLSLLQKIYQYGETLSSEELNQIVQYLNSSIEAINTLIARNNNINEGHCEMRYKVSAQQPEAPESGTDGKSNGWSDTYTRPDTANGEITWMTLSFFNGEGIYGDWSTPVCITWGSISGQRGPKGDTGLKGSFKSRVFKRQNTRPDTPTGGTYDNPLPTSGDWHDGIPSGQAIIWSSVCTFYGNGSSSGWSEPAAESDTDTLDIEFSPNSVQPDPPIGNTPFTNHESEGWYDPSSANFNNVGVMIWRAERKVSNGVYNGNWTITRIVGEKGAKGDSGDDGGHYKFRYCNFTPTVGHTTPTKPTQGSDGIGTFGSGADAATWAISVSDPNVNAGEFTYMTSCYVTGDNDYGTWDNPVRITGAEGMAGEDGSDIEFIYTVNNTGDIPDAPTASGQDNARIFTEDDWYGEDENGIIWTDNPTGISLENQYEYVAVREKPAGRGSSWSSYKVALWSKWGEKGMDGDGVQYIYKHFNYQPTWGAANAQSTNDVLGGNDNPANWAASTNSEYYGPIGYEWSDDPTGVDPTNKFEYVSVRRYKLWPNETVKRWGTYETPKLWSNYAVAEATVPGPRGKIGPMSYLAGVWNNHTTYEKTETKNPIVYYAGNYYYLIGENLPTSSYGENPSTETTVWAQAENYSTVFTDILFVNQFAKLGQFIINEDWMICQYGTIYDYGLGVHPIQSESDSISTGPTTTYTFNNAYTLFDPAYPDRRKPNDWNFVPNYAINAVTGELYCNDAHITGSVNATEFKAGTDNGFSITTSQDSLDFNYNGNRLAFFSLRDWDSTNNQLAEMSSNPTGFYLYMTNPLDGHLITIDFSDLSNGFKDLTPSGTIYRNPKTFYTVTGSNTPIITSKLLYYANENGTIKWYEQSNSTTELTASQMGTVYEQIDKASDSTYTYQFCVIYNSSTSKYDFVRYNIYREYEYDSTNHCPKATSKYVLVNANNSQFMEPASSTVTLASSNANFGNIMREGQGSSLSSISDVIPAVVASSKVVFGSDGNGRQITLFENKEENGTVPHRNYP